MEKPKFHINSAGNPGECRAKEGKCPFGADVPHYASEEEAYAAIAKENEGHYGSGVRKNTAKSGYFDADGNETTREKAQAAIDKAKANGDFEKYFELRRSFQLKEDGFIEITKRSALKAYQTPIREEDFEEMTESYKQEFVSMIHADEDRRSYNAGLLTSMILHNENTTDETKELLLAGLTEENRRAFAHFYNGSYGARNLRDIDPKYIQRIADGSEDKEVLYLAIAHADIPMSKKFVYAQQYDRGYLALGYETLGYNDGTKFDLNNPEHKDLYLGMVSRLGDDTDPNDRGEYFNFMARKLNDGDAIQEVYEKYVPELESYAYEVANTSYDIIAENRRAPKKVRTSAYRRSFITGQTGRKRSSGFGAERLLPRNQRPSFSSQTRNEGVTARKLTPKTWDADTLNEIRIISEAIDKHEAIYNKDESIPNDGWQRKRIAKIDERMKLMTEENPAEAQEADEKLMKRIQKELRNPRSLANQSPTSAAAFERDYISARNRVATRIEIHRFYTEDVPALKALESEN